MPYADYSQCPFGWLPARFRSEAAQYGHDVLQYPARIASGRRGDADAATAAVVRVDVVEADSGGGDQPYARTFEQGAVAAGAGAGNQHLGPAHIVGRDGASFQVTHFGVRFEHPFQERDVAVGYDQRFGLHVLSGFGRERAAVERNVPLPQS